MAKVCKDCLGRGKWQEREELPEGMVVLIMKYCNTCKGTGRADDVEDDEDFDFGRDSDADIE